MQCQGDILAALWHSWMLHSHAFFPPALATGAEYNKIRSHLPNLRDSSKGSLALLLFYITRTLSSSQSMAEDMIQHLLMNAYCLSWHYSNIFGTVAIQIIFSFLCLHLQP